MVIGFLPCCELLIAAGGVAVLLAIVLAIYVRVSTGKCTSTTNMKGKTVIVTGCTSGIGKETAKELAKRGARVIMACRTLSTANTLKDEIVASTGNEQVIVHHLDLGSLESVREFCATINSTEKRLDVLIHNAGTADVFHKQKSPEDIELTMATNHYGPFLMTHLLIDLLKKSKPSRIVIVASSLYRLARLNLENLNPINTFPAYLYYVSKYANISFTLELARRLEGTGVTANCLHPGLIDSGIWRNVPFPMNLPMKLIIKGFFKNTEDGAQTTLHLAISEEVEGISGKYFSDCKEAALSQDVQDPVLGKKFWEASENIVKLGANDPRI